VRIRGAMRSISNIFWLGTKELRSFLHDYVLIALVILGAEQFAGAA
jgi:hypothetical protein